DAVVTGRVLVELAIDHRRPHLSDGALERGDEIEQGQRVESLVWKAQPAGLLQAQHLGGAAAVLGLSHSTRAVAQRLPLAGDHGRYFVARPGVPGDGAAAPEHPAVG